MLSANDISILREALAEGKSLLWMPDDNEVRRVVRISRHPEEDALAPDGDGGACAIFPDGKYAALDSPLLEISDFRIGSPLGSPVEDQPREYVLCVCQDRRFRKVLVVRKSHPEWQAGKFNLPGGHVRKGEPPRESALRKLREETGVVATEGSIWRVCTLWRQQIDGGPCVVHVYAATYDAAQEFKSPGDEPAALVLCGDNSEMGLPTGAPQVTDPHLRGLPLVPGVLMLVDLARHGITIPTPLVVPLPGGRR